MCVDLRNRKESTEQRNSKTRQHGADAPSVATDGSRSGEGHNPQVNDPSANKNNQPSEGAFIKITAVFTVVLGIAAIVTNLQTCSALRESRHDFDQTIEQTKRLADNAEKQLTYSQRPWVGPGIITVVKPLAHGEPMEITVVSENGGRSPALHEVSLLVLVPKIVPHDWRTVIKEEVPDCLKEKPIWDDNLGGSLILPSTGGLASSSVASTVKSRTLSNKDVDAILQTPTPVPTPTSSASPVSTSTPTPTPTPEPPSLSDAGTINLFVIGCMNYFDEFKQPHRTYVCEWFIPNTATPQTPFRFCNLGNNGD